VIINPHSKDPVLLTLITDFVTDFFLYLHYILHAPFY